MRLSCVIRMPDLSKLDIPERLRLISVKDDQIFHELKIRNRRIEDQEDGAAKGDYVLIDAINSHGGSRTLHIELGKKCFPDYEKVLLGCQVGQELRVVINGEDTVIHIQSVRRVIELSLTDDTIASLRIPDVATLIEYRRKYLRQNGEKIADCIFRAIQPRLIDNVLALADISLDADEMDLYNQQQRTMLQNISGDVDQRLMKAYGADGTKTLEECYRQFYEDNKRTFSMYLWGKALAGQEHATPTESEYRQALTYYCLVFNKTEEQVEQEGLREEMLRSFYLQYGINRLKDYYKSMVSFSAAGIPLQPLKRLKA